MKYSTISILIIFFCASSCSHEIKNHPHHQHENTIKAGTLFDIGDSLNETSGAIFDKNQQVFWAVGDSGPMVLARIDENNKDVQIVPIKGVVGSDREELVIDKNGFLWILCTGDNHDRKDKVHLNQVDLRSYVKGKPLDVIRTIQFTYPGSPNDVEGAFVYKNELFLIQKSFIKQSWIYTVDLSPNSSNIQVAKYFKQLADAPKLITAACIDENDRVFFLTYWGVYEIKHWKKKDNLYGSMVDFNPLQWTSETLVCKDNHLIVARETGRFFYSTYKK